MASIVIQAGHYPRKRGATGTGGLDGDPTEQEFTIQAANVCAVLIRQKGHQARVVHADIPVRDYAGDGFISVHCDGSVNRSAHGASVGYQNQSGKRFAEAWKRAYAKQGWVGFRPDNYTPGLAGYYGVRHALSSGNKVAFIAEAGFLTNPGDEAKLSLPGGPLRFARAVADAVAEIFGTPSVPTTPPDSDSFQEEDMFLYSAPNEPVFFCAGGVSVGLNEWTDMKTFLDQGIKWFKLDGDTFAKFRKRYPGA